MALSNIFNEPRREITETLVGIGGVLAVPALFYPLGLGINAEIGYRSLEWWQATIVGAVGLFFLAVALVMLLVVAVALHRLGEGVCALLDGFGIELRPKRPKPEKTGLEGAWGKVDATLAQTYLRVRLPTDFTVMRDDAYDADLREQGRKALDAVVAANPILDTVVWPGLSQEAAALYSENAKATGNIAYRPLTPEEIAASRLFGMVNEPPPMIHGSIWAALG